MTDNNIPSIKIKVYEASYGDSFLVSCNSDLGKSNILIDAGFVGTYRNEIKNELQLMKSRDESLDKLIVTHFDADHISGALTLLQENGTNGTIITIDEIWHNTLRHIILDSERVDKVLSRTDKKVLEGISKEGFPVEEMEEEDDTHEGEEEIGAEQGSALGAWILKGNYKWNTSVGGAFTPIAVESVSIDGVEIGKGITLKILSPDKEKLDLLKKEFIHMLKKKGYSEDEITKDELFDDAFEFLNSNVTSRYTEDINISNETPAISLLRKFALQSVFDDHKEDDEHPNGSSIAFVLEFFDKKILFLGDSHPTLIEKQLRRHYPNKELIVFDLIKISHHGSKKNTSPALLKLIDSSKYIISTNGFKFDHPDLETIARIITRDLPEGITNRDLYFNYKTDVSEAVDDNDLKDELHYDVNYQREILL